MKSLMRLTLILVLITGLITSCKKKVPKQVRHIPATATVVATINSKSLQNKLIKSQVTIENLLKNLSSNHDSTYDKGKKEWEDLKNSGIDLDEDIYVAFEQKGGGMAMGKTTGVASVLATLNDASKLEAYLKKKDPSATVQKEKDYSYIIDGDKMVAWADDVVIGMQYQKSFAGGMEFDSTTQTYNFNKPKDVNSANDLKSEMAAYITRKEDASVASMAEFRDLMQQKSDASIWVNSAGSIAELPLPLPKLKELLQNNYTAATLDFEDGKIAMNSKSYSSKPLADLMDKYSGTTADLDLVERYPSSNIDGFMVAGVNPELFTGIVNFLEVGGLVDSYLTKFMGTNYTFKDLMKAFKGDFVFVASDLVVPSSDSTRQPGATMASSVPMKFLFNATVGDKTQLTRILDKMVAEQLLVKRGNEYVLNDAIAKTGISVSIDDKFILAGTDGTMISQYKANSGKAVLNKDVMSNFKGKPVAMYVDLEKIMAAFPPSKEYDSVFTSAKATFRDMTAYSDKFNGKFAEGHFDLRMKDEKENSLTSLVKFFAVAGEKMKSQQEKMKETMSAPMDEDVQADTTTN